MDKPIKEISREKLTENWIESLRENVRLERENNKLKMAFEQAIHIIKAAMNQIEETPNEQSSGLDIFRKNKMNLKKENQ
ncbi:MAG: hypothetical protein NVV82_00245 [Sporocytophaga sp.]|nr:hypothetical protein [Sporocytophaga sp.]